MNNENDKDAFFDKIYIEDYDNLKNLAAKAFSDRDIAQDLVQETFLVALEKIDELMVNPNPHGWLVNTLKNRIKKQYTKRKQIMETFVPYIDEHGSKDLDLSFEFEYSDMLTVEEMLLIKDKYFDLKQIPEISQELGISIDACKKRLQRARDKIEKELEQIERE